MTTAKIAILMSTYNGQKYLSEQIESIQKQSYSNWQLYIRDDGSTDNT
ncbi:glycosyltransferase, partial [Limosilactobacillus reuteri]